MNRFSWLEIIMFTCIYFMGETCCLSRSFDANWKRMGFRQVEGRETQVRSFIECAAMCGMIQCSNFFYKKNTSKCIFETGYAVSPVSDPQDNWTYYGVECSVCPDTNWQQNGTSCYYFSTEILTWYQARDFCQELGGYLVEITSSTENTYLQSEAKKHFQSASFIGNYDDIVWGYWTGLKHINYEWIWVNSGARLTYSSWYPGEPVDVGDLCVHLAHHMEFNWNDNFCPTSEYFICEIGASDCDVIG